MSGLTCDDDDGGVVHSDRVERRSCGRARDVVGIQLPNLSSPALDLNMNA